jgi:hypothetical protein
MDHANHYTCYLDPREDTTQPRLSTTIYYSTRDTDHTCTGLLTHPLCVFSHRYHRDTSDPLKRAAHNAKYIGTQGDDPIEYFESTSIHPLTHTSLDTPQLRTSEVFYVYYYISIGDEISTSNRSNL